MKELPTPAELLAKAKAMPVKARPQQLHPFLPVVDALRSKGYSYPFIARFLCERTGSQFKTATVYSCFKYWKQEAAR